MYSVEVASYDRTEALWGVVGDYVVEKGNDHDEIGLRGFDIFLMKTRRGLLEKD